MSGKTSLEMGDFMPSKFSMVHAAVDIVLIVGVTVWLNGKINAISVENKDAEILELKKQNDILNQRLQRVEQILQQLLQGPPPPVQHPVQEPEKKKKKKRRSSPTHSEEEESDEVSEVVLNE